MQKRIHQYVLEAVTGLPAVQKTAKKSSRGGIALSLIAAMMVGFITVASDRRWGPAMLVISGLILAGIPFSLFIQSYVLRLSLSKENLRIKDILIGRRNFRLSEDRSFILDDDSRQVERNFYADLTPFSIACNLISSEPALVPPHGSSAWQALRTFDELPGVAVGFTSFGSGGNSYAFIHGLPTTILANSTEMWDLGHVRKFSDSDMKLFKKTNGSWKKQSKAVVAAAYVALPKNADPLTLDTDSLAGRLTLLGAASMHGTREYGKSFPLGPAASLRLGVQSNLSTTVMVLTLSVLSYLAAVLFSTPVMIGLAQIALLKLLIEPLPIAATAWDQAVRNKANKFSLVDSLWSGVLIALLGVVSFVLYFELHGFNLGHTASSSIAHQGALATSFLTIASCLLVTVVLLRHDAHQSGKKKSHNPFFALGMASAVLCISIGTYATGPVVAIDLVLAVAAVSIFTAIQMLKRYASAQHTREHILEILKTV